MKILEKEIGLREETRGTEQVREVLESEAYAQRADGLSQTQETLAKRTADVTQKIRELASKGLEFPKEIALLTRVEEVMREAQDLLARPDTGPEPIAAETEAIELLLQAKRMKPPKGGGGGGSTPGGGGSGDTDESALALIGRGDEANAASVDRNTAQATGVTGTAYPAEFRAGLDAYFDELEK